MVSFFEELVKDSHDTTQTYQLLNLVRARIEHWRPWEILKGVDETQTASVGNTYLSMKTLPTDFRSMRKLVVGILKYSPVPFEDRIRYKDSARRWYADIANGQFALTGRVNTSTTIVQVYTKRGTTLTAGLTWNFPSDYHPIIPFYMAEIYQGNIDPDDIAVRQALRQNKEAALIIDMMEMWDDELKATSQADRLDYAEDDLPDSDLALM